MLSNSRFYYFSNTKKALIICIFLIFFGFSNSSLAQPQSSVLFKDLTIIVSSCDKYQEFWDPFFTFLFKNWPSLKKENNHIPILLITNKKTYPDPRITVIQTGPDKSWSLSMLKVLEQVKTKYVLYLQEDFIIHLPVKKTILQNLLSLMEQESSAYIELAFDSYFANEPIHPFHKDIAVIRPGVKYRAGLEASFWRKGVFQALLNPDEIGPWEFETFGSIRSQNMPDEFWIVQKNHPIIYFNACDRGYWVHPVLDYINTKGINIPIRRLPTDKDYPLIHWIKHYNPTIYKYFIKLDAQFNTNILKHEQIDP